MRTVCDVCESAAAILFCAADEAALCRSCDDKVYCRFYPEVYLCMCLFICLSHNRSDGNTFLFTLLR